MMCDWWVRHSMATVIHMLLLLRPPPAVIALDAFEFSYNHYHLATFNISVKPSDKGWHMNHTVISLIGKGKYGYFTQLKDMHLVGQVHTTRWEERSGVFALGCREQDYTVPQEDKGSWIALVERHHRTPPSPNCDMTEQIKVADKAGARAIILYASKQDADKSVHELLEYNVPIQAEFHNTYKTNTLDHHKKIDELSKNYKIPYILSERRTGLLLLDFATNGTKFTLAVVDAGEAGAHFNMPSSSLLLVFIAFIILTIISMIWLIFYYVQRFRFHHHQDKLLCQMKRSTKKAMRMLPTRVLKETDEELEPSFGRCPICLDPFREAEIVRALPCNHVYHKSCVDSWLVKRPTCPNCKSNILKALGLEADFDIFCVDASSNEPDAISLVDSVPVISIQVFSQQHSPPSQYITDLMTIPAAAPGPADRPAAAGPTSSTNEIVTTTTLDGRVSESHA